MKKTILILFIAICSIIFAITGKVVSVYDGDTITIVMENNEKVKIRFYGIDCPEVTPKQEFGLEARNYLNSLIYGKDVQVNVKDKDRYGRVVGEVYLKNRNLNIEMLRQGYAWYYKRYAKNRYDYKEAQEFAISNKKGLWSSNPIAPWEFRRNKKLK